MKHATMEAINIEPVEEFPLSSNFNNILQLGTSLIDQLHQDKNGFHNQTLMSHSLSTQQANFFVQLTLTPSPTHVEP